MVDITQNIKIERTQPFQGRSEAVIETPDDSDSGDTFDVNLSDYGIKEFLTIQGFIHQTLGSVVVPEDPTTAVADGVLTVTIGGSTSDKKRVYVIKGK